MVEPVPYSVEFFEDDSGGEPALAFMRSLTPQKRRAIGVAIHEVLRFEGPKVAETNMGDSLGGGLFEFRLDQTAEQILHRKGKTAQAEPKAKILIRVFFLVHGEKIVLLLSGYDKGERPSKRNQDAEIAAARALQTQWKEREKRKGSGPPKGRKGRS